MKNNKTLLILLAVVLAAAFALGAAGVVTFAEEQATHPGEPGGDRLIGVWVTTEYLDLFDFESYCNDNAGKIFSGTELSLADSAPYQGRLYATLVEQPLTDTLTGTAYTEKKYVFPDKNGMGFFCASYTDETGTYTGTSGDEAISDMHTAIHSTDREDRAELTGTIYVSTESGIDTFYYNPVYQTPSGEVYALSGQGMCYGEGALFAGASGSHKLEGEQTVTVDGKSKTFGISVTVKICYQDTPTDIRVLQFDGENRLVAAQHYAPGELPERITTEARTDYLLVETAQTTADGTQTRTRALYQPEDTTLAAFFCRDDGICIRQDRCIVWA